MLYKDKGWLEESYLQTKLSTRQSKEFTEKGVEFWGS
jgi:hypothetical protein